MNFRGANASYYPLAITIAILLLLPAIAFSQSYVQSNLVSNSKSIPASTTDPNLVNPWGMVQGPSTPFWVSDQVTNLSTVYTGNGTKLPLNVGIPTIGTGPVNGPTGIVFNSGTGFSLSTTSSVPSLFLFDDLNGTIDGWNPKSSGGTASAVTGITTPGATYTGLAINATGSLVYAANFASSGGVNVFNSSWKSMGSLNLPSSISLPSNYEPYNVSDVSGTLFIAYDLRGSNGLPVLGAGDGAVIEYDPTTGMYTELVKPGRGDGLDAPWGFAMAPSSGFGKFSGDLLVGDFGSGWISAYNPSNGDFLGYLDNTSGKPIADGGLWTLDFGNGADGTNPDTLYITAGITQPFQTQGLLAAINQTPEPSTFALFGTAVLAMAFIYLRRKHSNAA
ncbi:MAG TPA: TIGR03118 family protein [Terriglobia bacterium]|nr:TIGR03118 family protein [Terriglobia bacterium]